MKTSSNRNNRTYVDNGIESLREGVGRELKSTGASAIDQFFKDFLKGTAEGIPKQLVPQEKTKTSHSGELVEGQEMVLKKQEEQKVEVKRSNERAVMHREYFRRYVETREPTNTQEQQTNNIRIQEVQAEIRKLISASQEMEIAFKEVSADISTKSITNKPSNYEAHFFQWVLLTIKNARARIEEGQNWLALFSSKRSQKQYWNMSKKHGTTFSQSGERSVATQTG
jgi:hypothetical protein